MDHEERDRRTADERRFTQIIPETRRDRAGTEIEEGLSPCIGPSWYTTAKVNDLSA